MTLISKQTLNISYNLLCILHKLSQLSFFLGAETTYLAWKVLRARSDNIPETALDGYRKTPATRYPPNQWLGTGQKVTSVLSSIKVS